MVIKKIRIDGSTIKFEWHPDPTGDGGLVSMAPGVIDFHSGRLPDGTDSDEWSGILPGQWVLASCQDYQDRISARDLHVWSSLTDPEGNYGTPQVYTLWGTPDGTLPVTASLALYDRRDRTKVVRCIHARYVPEA